MWEGGGGGHACNLQVVILDCSHANSTQRVRRTGVPFRSSASNSKSPSNPRNTSLLHVKCNFLACTTQSPKTEDSIRMDGVCVHFTCTPIQYCNSQSPPPPYTHTAILKTHLSTTLCNAMIRYYVHVCNLCLVSRHYHTSHTHTHIPQCTQSLTH